MYNWFYTPFKNDSVKHFYNFPRALYEDSLQLLIELFDVTLSWNFLYRNMLKKRLSQTATLKGTLYSQFVVAVVKLYQKMFREIVDMIIIHSLTNF